MCCCCLMILIKMNYKQYSTIIESISIDSLLREIQSKNLELNPTYQRGVIWNGTMQSNFIDSIISGIVPNNLIFNKEYSDDRMLLTCIDGKQRITSIIKFKNNEIPFYLKNNDNDDIEDITYIYFDKIPENVKMNKNIKCNVLNNKDKMDLFLDRKIPIAYYSCIEYSSQVDIFKRINNSTVATPGEIFISKFRNQSAGVLLKNFLDSINFPNSVRCNHYDYIFKTLYIFSIQELKILNNNTRDKNGMTREERFIKCIDSHEKMKELLGEYKDYLMIFFSDKMIFHKNIKKQKMDKYFIIATCYLVKNILDDANYDINDMSARKIIRSKINELWKIIGQNYNKNKSTDKYINIISHKFDEIFHDS
jgi:hypothetical protein